MSHMQIFGKQAHIVILLFVVMIISCHVSAQTYPPSSVIIMPHSNAYFKAGTDVVIKVYATDIGKSANNGMVSKVEFFNGTTKIGESTTQTNNIYTFTWQCVPAGTYTIKATATNNKGVAFTSVGVIITVGTADVTPRGMSANKGKYLANIIANSANINYNTYWNGVTAENSCKWGSVEGTRNIMNWNGADVSYNYAKNNNMMFRYHAALWAAQYPSWLLGLSTADARAEVVEYMKAIAARYPLIDQIDVLNEQLGNHQADNQKFRDLFSGITNCPADNFSWQIWLFEQARAIFPNTKLVLNDYGLENDQNAINMQLNLLKALRDRGLVDGFGTQAHCFNIDGLTATALKSSLDKMAGAGIPIYVTELDLNGGSESNTNDAVQLTSYQNHFPVYWDHPAVAGISLWGYVTGATWIGGTGLISNTGVEKSAMTWLKQYVAGKTNVGYPFASIPGTCDGAPVISITLPTANQTYTAPATVSIAATATAGTGKTISKVEFYNGTTKLGEDATSPYTYSWTNVAAGTYSITAVATDNTGAKTTSAAVSIKVNVAKGPYGGTAPNIPGKIEFENFDVGGNGVGYLDNTPGTSVPSPPAFRTDEDVDIETCTDAGGGYNIGYATAGEWLEYSVNVVTAGTYTLTLRVACQGDGRTLSVAANGVTIANNVAIPNTGGWQTWQDVVIPNITLTAGAQVIRVTIGATDYINLNYMTFAAATTPAPTVTTPVTYCQGATATALTATGTALKWYTVATGGTASTTAPTPSTATAGSTTYYVSQTVNNVESSRAAIVVTVNALPTATITASGATTFCNGAGSVTLSANTGTGLTYQWWRNQTTAVGTGTSTHDIYLTSGSYTVEITNAAGCKAISNAIVVTVNAVPAAPTVSSPVNYTVGQTATALTATGTALKWYTVATGGTASTTAPTPSTAAVGSTTYYVSQTVNTCESARAAITVTVSQQIQSIQLQPGWNMIGCPLQGTTNMQQALSSIWSQVETVKDQDSFWDIKNVPALNSLSTVKWGQGYLVKVKAACTLDWIIR